jgi:hypothetical protein
MDIEGIDVSVMYGTRGRQILCHDDLAPDNAAALARAYNNWARDYCKTDPQRLKFAGKYREFCSLGLLRPARGLEIREQFEGLMRKFPTHRNREFISA